MPRSIFQITVNLPGNFRTNNVNNNEVFNPYAFMRYRLYGFIFSRFALVYTRIFSQLHRKLIEFSILVAALSCFVLSVYVHIVFVKYPITCLDGYKAWNPNGILRVEVLSRKGKENYTLEDSYLKERNLRLQEFLPPEELNIKGMERVDVQIDAQGNVLSFDNVYESEEIAEPENSTEEVDLRKLLLEENFQPISEETVLANDPEGSYIVEFALEYGFLRLRPSKRKELNISVTFVVLDPEVDQCFGGSFNRFLMDNFLGYGHVLLTSIKNLAEMKEQKGFVRNAVSEIEYMFINQWENERSYFTAAFVMITFTQTISILLRHSHQQIFIVVGFWMQHILNAMERPSNVLDVLWPRNIIPSSGAPVLAIVLALVGMEAVMSDFFRDKYLALNVIVIVWFADLYEAVCCQSYLSKKHWHRFFYLYHLVFYVYNYKFGGFHAPLTLLTSSLFTFHAMIFFFHHYELPRFLQRHTHWHANPNHAHQPNHPGEPPQSPNNNRASDTQHSNPPDSTASENPNSAEPGSTEPHTAGTGTLQASQMTSVPSATIPPGQSGPQNLSTDNGSFPISGIDARNKNSTDNAGNLKLNETGSFSDASPVSCRSDSHSTVNKSPEVNDTQLINSKISSTLKNESTLDEPSLNNGNINALTPKYESTAFEQSQNDAIQHGHFPKPGSNLGNESTAFEKSENEVIQHIVSSKQGSILSSLSTAFEQRKSGVCPDSVTSKHDSVLSTESTSAEQCSADVGCKRVDTALKLRTVSPLRDSTKENNGATFINKDNPNPSIENLILPCNKNDDIFNHVIDDKVLGNPEELEIKESLNASIEKSSGFRTSGNCTESRISEFDTPSQDTDSVNYLPELADSAAIDSANIQLNASTPTSKPETRKETNHLHSACYRKDIEGSSYFSTADQYSSTDQVAKDTAYCSNDAVDSALEQVFDNPGEMSHNLVMDNYRDLNTLPTGLFNADNRDGSPPRH